jgi:hypothetical protein
MDCGPVKIFCRSELPRLNYIAGILLGDLLGLNFEMVRDRRKLGKNPVINYSTEHIEGAVKIIPSTLLYETGISKHSFTIGEWRNLPVFFQTDTDSDIPFDIFAASFYLVTRYEEYLDHNPDRHGRFPVSLSISFMNGFLNRPVVDLWTKELAMEILRKYPSTTFKRNEFNSLLTVDSDQPFAYQGKGIIRNIGGLISDLIAGRGHMADRYKVLAGVEKDPYQVYDYIVDNIEKHNAAARFFFPTADFSKYDKNPSWKNVKYRELIRKIAGQYETGLHSSYYTADNFNKMESQLKRLEIIIDKNVLASRFHFLRFSVPVSYRHLVQAGIREDYSMGYPEEPGFRAGIARPFLFYDILEEKQTTLRIIPFQVMDVTLCHYKKMEPEDAGEVIVKLINEIRNAGGLFVSLWHNTSLLGNDQWRGWRYLFETMLEAQKR